MTSRLSTTSGYSLFELIIVILIIGVIATITMRSLRGANDVIRTEQTREELDRLAWAIAGNPALISGGSRTDFGYIGDNGALPPNLDALVSNPGLGSWQGPYVTDDYLAASGGAAQEFRVDAWGAPYSFNGIAISSSGGGGSITRELAASADDLLYNPVTIAITDLDGSAPGSVWADSVLVSVTVPNGGGSYSTVVRAVGSDGFVRIDSLPIGSHDMAIIYIPTADMLSRRVVLSPGQHVHLDWQYPEDLW